MPGLTHYTYFQDFSGLDGMIHIDGHWYHNFSNIGPWSISNDASYSVQPPALIHETAAGGRIGWNVVVPGLIQSASAGFAYKCEANAGLSAAVSPTGKGGAAATFFAVRGLASTTGSFNLTSSLFNSTSAYIIFNPSSTDISVSDVCSIDDFFVRLDYLPSSSPSYVFSDTFTDASIVYNYQPGRWGVSSGDSDTPPNMEYSGGGSGQFYANWAFASVIERASVSFHYQCKSAGAVQVYMSRDGEREWTLAESIRGPPHTVVAINATGQLQGSHEIYLRFRGEANQAGTFWCGIDDIVVDVGLARSTLAVNIIRPVDTGAWTTNLTTDGSGTAGGPNFDYRVLNRTEDFSEGATFENVSAASHFLNMTLPPTTYEYRQNFSGVTGEPRIDEFWNANLTGLGWEVNGSSTLLPSAPALVHAESRSTSAAFRAVPPGPLASGYLSMQYACEANGTLLVLASSTGYAGGEQLLLSAGASNATTLEADLTAALVGGPAAFIRFEGAGSGPSGNACAIDDVFIQLNYTRVYHTDFDLWETLDNGWQASWTSPAGNFSIVRGGYLAINGSTAQHSTWDNDSLWANFATIMPIESASVNFSYACRPYGSIFVWVSADGTNESNVLWAPENGFQSGRIDFNATSLLAGGRSLTLRISMNGTRVDVPPVGPSNYECAFDDIHFRFDFRGYPLPNATYTSSYTSGVIDYGQAADLVDASYGAVLPPSTNVSVTLRWSGDNTTWGNWTPVSAPRSSVNASSVRYVQFRAEFVAIGGLWAPSIGWLCARFSRLVAVEYSFDLLDWTPTVGLTSWTITGATLPPGYSTLFVRARDTALMEGHDEVDFRRDTFAPGAPGRPQAVALTTISSVTWNWTASTDEGLGVAHYLLDLGTTPTSSDVIAGRAVPGINVTLDNLPDGFYYARVRAVDGAGLISAFSLTSNGTRVDTTPPGPVTPIGPGRYTRAATIPWGWNDSVETGAGISGYQVTVGTTPGADDVVNLTTTAPAFELTGLADGETYYITVLAIDLAGLRGAPTTSAPTTVDWSPPGAPQNLSGPPALTNANDLTWTWMEAVDASSGIDHYEVVVGTRPGAGDVRSATTAQLQFTFSNAPSSVTYYLSVRAFDRVGFAGPWASAASVTIDRDPPTAPFNLTGPEPLTNHTLLTWRWGNAEDLVSSSFLFEYAVGTTEGAGEVAAGTTAAFNFTAADLPSGLVYYFAVRARDVAGNWGAWAKWPGVLVDADGPAAPVILPIPARTASASQVVQWDEASDLPSAANAGVDLYLVSVWDGLIANDYSTHNLSWVVDGKEGRTFTVKVAAVDLLGNIGPQSSVSFTFDRTGPAAPSVIRLLVVDNTTPTFEVRWEPSEDPAGVKGYWVSVGTSFVDADVANRVWTTDLVFPWPGLFNTTYYVKISAVDGLGNEGPAGNSNGGISAAPPRAPEEPAPAPQPKGFLPGLGVDAAVAALSMVGALLVERKRAGARRR